MVNTKILLSVVIVLLIGVAAATYQVTTTTPGLWQHTTSQDNQKSTDQGTTTQSDGSQTQTQTQSGTTSTGSQGTSSSSNGGSTVKISASDAQSIVQNNYIEQEGATAGTPKLTTMNGEKVYIVPVIYNGKQAGEIWIDAKTGKNVGGAGGAP